MHMLTPTHPPTLSYVPWPALPLPWPALQYESGGLMFPLILWQLCGTLWVSWVFTIAVLLSKSAWYQVRGVVAGCVVPGVWGGGPQTLLCVPSNPKTLCPLFPFLQQCILLGVTFPVMVYFYTK